jgi:hypothetical protein
MEAPEDRSVTTLYIGGVKPEFGISDDDLRYAVLPHALLLNRLQASLAMAVTRHLSCLVGLSRLARACIFFFGRTHFAQYGDVARVSFAAKQGAAFVEFSR